MTRNEAKGNLIHAIRWNDIPKKEALEMAIKALEQEPKTIQEKQVESEKYQKAFDDGYKNGYEQARFDYEQEPMREFTEEEAKAYSKALDKMYKPTGFNVFDEPCDDAINRQAVFDAMSETWRHICCVARRRKPTKNVIIPGLAEIVRITLKKILNGLSKTRNGQKGQIRRIQKARIMDEF